MTDKQAAKRMAPAFRAMLLLLVIAVVLGIAGSNGLGMLFGIGALVCLIVGVIQRDSVSR